MNRPPMTETQKLEFIKNLTALTIEVCKGRGEPVPVEVDEQHTKACRDLYAAERRAA